MRVFAHFDQRVPTSPYIPIPIPTYLLTYLPSYLSTYLPTSPYIPISIPTYWSTCRPICLLPTNIPACLPIYMYIHTYIRTYVRTYIHTYIRTYVRTYIHTYIRIATYYRALNWSRSWHDRTGLRLHMVLNEELSQPDNTQGNRITCGKPARRLASVHLLSHASIMVEFGLRSWHLSLGPASYFIYFSLASIHLGVSMFLKFRVVCPRK